MRTHLLMDGFGSHPLPKTMIADLNAAGAMVMMFRPKISPWTLRRHRLRRLHQKIVVIDQKVAFVGGLNIMDETALPDQTAPQYDYAVSVEGPLVGDIHISARTMWRRVARLRLPLHGCRESPWQPPFTDSRGGMRAAFLIRNNIRHRRDIERAYLRAIKGAYSEIILANAYFLPGIKFCRALLDAAARGVQVILLLQGRVDHRLFHYASKALYGRFLDKGIKIFEYHKSLMHAKVAVIDTHWSTVGSSNLDPFSLLLSLESNIVVDDESFAGTLRQSLKTAINSGARRVTLNSFKNRPSHQHIASLISYGLARVMTGMAGSAPPPGDQP